MSTIFVSYASQDRETARAIAGSLEAHGHSVWWDRTIPPGRVFDEVIQEALAAAQCVVVLWSSNSVRSNWVKVEAEEAAARGLLVPVLIENVTPPIQFKRIQAANLTEWGGEASHPEFRTLLAAIDRLLGRAPTPVAPQPVLRRTTAGTWQTVRTVLWSVGATLAVVAAVWVYNRPDESGAEAQPDVAETGTSGGRATGNLNASPPSPTSGGPDTATNIPAPVRRGDLINLVSPENGGKLITADHTDWSKTVDGDESTELWQNRNAEAVFGFNDGKSATVEAVEVLVAETSNYNVSELEVLTSTAGPEGPFTSVAIARPRNMLVAKERYQRTTFTPRTARFVKVRLLKAHRAESVPALWEWRLLGTLQ